ncbi:hypothetical protein PHYSODRAFT_513216, partial [Phytophthora sojae]
KLSTICLVHSYFATPKMIRLNSEYVAIIRANSKSDLKMVTKDFNIKNIDESRLIKSYDLATSSKGQALFVDSIRGELRFNFNRVIDPNSLN